MDFLILAVKTAIEKKDSALFASTYKTMLESCYACHKSVGRPYLRPMPLSGGDEEEARVQLLRTCRRGQHQLADPEGVLLDVVQE